VSISREVRKTEGSSSVSTYAIIGPIRDIKRGHILLQCEPLA